MMVIMHNVKVNFTNTAGYNEEILSSRGTGVYSSRTERPALVGVGRVSIAS
jgi:hypothetical protein